MNKIILGITLLYLTSCGNEKSADISGPKHQNAKLYINYNDSNVVKITNSGSGSLGEEKTKTLSASVSIKNEGADSKNADLNLNLIWESSKDGVDCYRVSRTLGIQGIKVGDKYYYNGSRLDIINVSLFSVYIK